MANLADEVVDLRRVALAGRLILYKDKLQVFTFGKDEGQIFALNVLPCGY